MDGLWRTDFWSVGTCTSTIVPSLISTASRGLKTPFSYLAGIVIRKAPLETVPRTSVDRVQNAGKRSAHFRFELPIPGVRVKLGEPIAKCAQFFSGVLLHLVLDAFQPAHDGSPKITHPPPGSPAQLRVVEDAAKLGLSDIPLSGVLMPMLASCPTIMIVGAGVRMGSAKGRG